MAIKYPIERKAEICSLVESKAMTVIEASKQYSVPVATIYTWLRQKKIAVQGTSQTANKGASKTVNSRQDFNAIEDDMTRPPTLGKLDMVASIALWQLVREHGADSPEVSLACSKKGIEVSELLAFGNWINKALSLNAFANCLVNQAEAQQDKQELARTEGETCLLKAEIKKRERAISEVKTEIEIRKKIEKLLS